MTTHSRRFKEGDLIQVVRKDLAFPMGSIPLFVPFRAHFYDLPEAASRYGFGLPSGNDLAVGHLGGFSYGGWIPEEYCDFVYSNTF